MQPLEQNLGLVLRVGTAHDHRVVVTEHEVPCADEGSKAGLVGLTGHEADEADAEAAQVFDAVAVDALGGGRVAVVDGQFGVDPRFDAIDGGEDEHLERLEAVHLRALSAGLLHAAAEVLPDAVAVLPPVALEDMERALHLFRVHLVGPHQSQQLDGAEQFVAVVVLRLGDETVVVLGEAGVDSRHLCLLLAVSPRQDVEGLLFF